jgi:hypothetical protein
MQTTCMKRATAILLALMFLAIGSGAAEYLHLRQHAMEDAAEAKHGAPSNEHHDESNCEVCAQLHIPVTSRGWVPLLIFAGFFVAFLTQLPQSLVSQRAFFRIACRGPPVCI